MVRLKGKFFALGLSNFPSFQFQYGAIERTLKTVRDYARKQFQFQYGAIERYTDAQLKVKRIEISIPVWCD